MRDEKEEKRKRVRQEEEDMNRDIFKKSNKIVRTPPKLGEDEKKTKKSGGGEGIWKGRRDHEQSDFNGD